MGLAKLEVDRRALTHERAPGQHRHSDLPSDVAAVPPHGKRTCGCARPATALSRDAAELCWRNRSFLVLLIAQFISFIGSHMSLVAIPWFVLSRTGSPGRMTIVLVAETLPLVLLGPLGGVIVDRLDHRKLMIGLDVLRGGALALLAFLATAGALNYWTIVFIAGFNGALTSLYLPARLALVPALVGEDERELTIANTLMQFGHQLSMIIGPGAAGLVIASVGNANAILLDGISYGAGALLIAVGVRTSVALRKATTGEDRAIFGGLSFIRGNAIIRSTIGLGTFAEIGISILTVAAVPVLVRDVLRGDAGDTGLMLAAWGVGSTIGMIAFALLSKRTISHKGKTIVGFVLGMAVSEWVVPLTQTLLGALVGLALLGVFAGPLGVIILTILQTQTPVEVRGRVFAAFNALWLIGTPLALLVVGPILEEVGVVPILWCVAALVTLVFVASLQSRAIRAA